MVIHNFLFRELVKQMLEQEHNSGEVLQAFDRINPETEPIQTGSKCCFS